MKYLFLALLLLSGCVKQFPGQFEARITGSFYRDSDSGRTYWTEVFSTKYGMVKIFNSPYREAVKVGDRVMVGCAQTNGSADDCRILGAISEPKQEGQ